MSRRVATVATCNLDQWAMDFESNLQRVKASIKEARRRGARYRVGPELELCGYGCEDHFFEVDTVSHSWEALAELLEGDYTDDMLCDVGMPVIHRGVLYNCRVFLLNRRVVLVRPKLAMANDGNYRETRYFSSWKHRFTVEQTLLPACVRAVTTGHQTHAPFGDGVLSLADTTLAAETCEELFTPRAPHVDLALAGVELISNGSGSHHQLRKLDTRLDLIRSATAKAGGVYLYANQRGCDGGRLYYDGCACVVVNGQLVAQGSQFSLRDVEVLLATVDLDEVVSYRGAIASLREQASEHRMPSYVEVPGWCLCHRTEHVSPSPQLTSSMQQPVPAAPDMNAALGNPADGNPMGGLQGMPVRPPDGSGASGGKARDESALAHVLQQDSVTPGMEANGIDRMHSLAAEAAQLCLFPSQPFQPRIVRPEEEIAYGPACWLWDYLRRSGAAGFLLPLSGGADSSSTAAIVGAMCQMVCEAVAAGDERVRADAARIGQYKEGEAVAPNPQELAGRLFCTTYMGTVNSSKETRERQQSAKVYVGCFANVCRARQLASEVGSYHLDVGIDIVVQALVELFVTVTGKRPRFRADGGGTAENLALQNIQARLRMIVAFLLAQLVPWVRGRDGWLLVLGSANVDEALRGYLTKYDCSSADINPIGGISKQDLRRFLRWAAVHLGYPSLAHVEAAPPTAELEPLREGHKPQNDEDDMGMTYEELSLYGRLRKVARCGPVSMFMHCMDAWHNMLSPQQVADKVKHFFKYYSINRHKTTVLTPSYHAESYSPDDNRFDHRQFLYNIRWPWQFKRIDHLVMQFTNRPAAAAAAPASVKQ